MQGHFRAVKPMTGNSIEAASIRLRRILGIEPPARVQMVQLLENVLPEVLDDYTFEVLPDEDMPGMDGLSAVGSFSICLANHTYEDLCNGSATSRVVAAHELGHLVLHSQQEPAWARRTRNDSSVDPEWQADRFADYWLLPREAVEACETAEEVAAKYTVPLELAQRRFVEVKQIQGELF